MKEISLSELNNLYIDTLNRCGAHLLDMDDETIGFEIFEEFDIGVVSFLHPDTLIKLRDGGLISEKKMIKSIELRNKVMALQSTTEWNVPSVRNSEKWKEILKLSDEIKTLK